MPVYTEGTPPTCLHQHLLSQTKLALTFSLPQFIIQGQQNRWPHSVAHEEVRSSKHNVHTRLARSSAGTLRKSITVPSSSSAGTGGLDSSFRPNISEIGTPSMFASKSVSPRIGAFPFAEVVIDADARAESFVSSLRYALIAVTRRCRRRIAMRIPSNAYEGGRAFGFSAIEEA